MSETAIRVRGLGKRYRISAQQQPANRLSEAIVNSVTEPLRRARWLLSPDGRDAADRRTTIWALRDVSFEVKRGELIGVIGPNGAGKSTLLKVLSRITEPTEGSADLYGRASTLLEVGTGFHSELTGRENIYLSGSILGMRRAKIAARFNDIVSFASVERFIDTPVKHYSSGMYLRLAFSVAAYLDPDILLVDEILAVGDAEFQKRCLGLLEERRDEGKTALFVSHNTVLINNLTTRALWLDSGRLRMDGPTRDVTAAYLMSNVTSAGEVVWEQGFSNPDVTALKVFAVRLKDVNGDVRTELDASSPFYVEIEYLIDEALPYCRVGILVSTEQNLVLFSAYDADNPAFQGPRQPGRYISRCKVPAGLFKSAQYVLTINAGMPRIKNLARIENIIRFTMINSGQNPAVWEPQRVGVISPALDWQVESEG